MNRRRNPSDAVLRAVGRYVKATHPDEIEYAKEEGRSTSDLAMGQYAYEQHDEDGWAELVAHVKASSRRRNPGFLGTLGLMGGAFVGGLVVERQRGYAQKAETRARGLIASAKKAVASPFEKKPAAQAVKNDLSWSQVESPDGKGYFHTRRMNGVEYVVFERVYSDGARQVFLEVGPRYERVLAPNGKEDGWKTVAAAKRAAEALAAAQREAEKVTGMRGPRKNPVSNLADEGMNLVGFYGAADEVFYKLAHGAFGEDLNAFLDAPAAARTKKQQIALVRKRLKSLGLDPAARAYGIDYLFIAQQQKGQGTNIVRKIEQTLREEGEKMVFLLAVKVFGDTRHSRAFWERMGYTEVPGDYEPLVWENGPDSEDDRIMYKML